MLITSPHCVQEKQTTLQQDPKKCDNELRAVLGVSIAQLGVSWREALLRCLPAASSSAKEAQRQPKRPQSLR